MDNRWWLRIAALGLAFVVAGASVANGAPSATEWNRVIVDAKKEAAVVMFLNPGEDEEFQAVADAFHKEYGIRVTFAYGSGAENAQKVFAEVQTGHVRTDVYQAGLGPIYGLYKAGDVVPLDLPNAANVIRTFDVLPGSTPLFVLLFGLLVNTVKLGNVPLPTSWAAAINPAFNGKIVMQDPRTDGGGGTLFVATYDKLGPDFERKLAAEHPVIMDAGGGNAAEEALARGDFTLMLAGRTHALATFPQAPLKWIAPREGAIAVPVAMMMVKGAPHPNAARLWANYLLRPDMQSILSQIVTPVVRNVTIKSPRVKLEASARFLTVSPSLDRTGYYAKARELYSAQ